MLIAIVRSQTIRTKTSLRKERLMLTWLGNLCVRKFIFLKSLMLLPILYTLGKQKLQAVMQLTFLLV
jgi:hypothetical protein